MSRHRSNWISVVVVMVILAMGSLLHLSLNTPVAYACTDCESITNTPTVALTLNGTDQTVNYPLTFSLNNTGTGGWHLSIGSTQFTMEGNSMHTLPPTASSVVNVTSVCQASHPCGTLPQNVITYPVGVPVMPITTTFYDAQANSGIGNFDITVVLAIRVPANAYKGIYTSIATLALATGP